MKKLLLPLIVCLFAAGCAPKGKPMLLRLSFKQGDVFSIRYHVNASSSEDANIVNEATRVTFKVDSVIADEYLLSCKVDYIRAKNNGEMAVQREEYYSEKSEETMSASEKEMHTAFKPILDSTLLLRINNRGRITKGFTYKDGSPLNNLGGPIDMENCFVPFPEKPVHMYEDWTEERVIPLTGGTKKTSYSVNGMHDGVLQIVPTGELQAAKAIGRKSKFSGEYLLDEKTKQLLTAKIETEAEFMFGKGKIILSISAE